MSDPFKKSFWIHGVFVPLFIVVVICLGVFTAHSEIHRSYRTKKLIYDEMTQQQTILEQNKTQRELLNRELPRLKEYYQSIQMTQATARIASQCSDEKGIKLGDLKELTSASKESAKTWTHQMKLLGRSAPLLEILGEMQNLHPAIQVDGWSLSLQNESQLLSFQGNLQLVTPP